ncbi:transmembrane protein 100 [Scleropages formosus]|uniref:transmembrane protein 100 n=1 Tax=Scleropages formosus TaxID=113540 RepID=UPI0010FA87C9|nr:transmembrane protein 100-like [Scleropages formosus]
MGCTASPVSCQPPPFPAPPSQDGGQQHCEPKTPEVPSSLERLSQATGGMEKSWYRCIFPFGLISLVIGTAATSVTFTYDQLPQVRVLTENVDLAEKLAQRSPSWLFTKAGVPQEKAKSVGQETTKFNDKGVPWG